MSSSTALGWYVSKAYNRALPAHACGDMAFRRAGCREICLSGSTRGEWVALVCRPLSYSTGLRGSVFSSSWFRSFAPKDVRDRNLGLRRGQGGDVISGEESLAAAVGFLGRVPVNFDAAIDEVDDPVVLDPRPCIKTSLALGRHVPERAR